jgi:hypothetical protein
MVSSATPYVILDLAEQPKMTRKEAIKKLDDDLLNSHEYNERFIRRLEILGLLKLEEEKKGNLIANIIGFSAQHSHCYDLTQLGHNRQERIKHVRTFDIVQRSKIKMNFTYKS